MGHPGNDSSEPRGRIPGCTRQDVHRCDIHGKKIRIEKRNYTFDCEKKTKKRNFAEIYTVDSGIVSKFVGCGYAAP